MDFVARRRAQPAQPDRARAAALERAAAGLLVRPRHAGVRPRGVQPVPRGGTHGAPRARDRAEGRLVGARRDARDGDAGPHRRRHRLAAVARAGLGARQRLRLPQLVAPRAVLPRQGKHRPGARPVRHGGASGARGVRARRWSTRPRCCGGSRSKASTSATAGTAWRPTGSRASTWSAATTRSTTCTRCCRSPRSGRAAAAGRLQLELQATALEGARERGPDGAGSRPAAGARRSARTPGRTSARPSTRSRRRATRPTGSAAVTRRRDLLSLTLIEAARRAGRPRLARHILAERQTLKPTAWSDRIARRIGDEDAGAPSAAA